MVGQYNTAARISFTFCSLSLFVNHFSHLYCFDVFFPPFFQLKFW